jgi:hypothetical protein
MAAVVPILVLALGSAIWRKLHKPASIPTHG